MKLILIKIGKAWQTIKRDGIVKGSRRIIPAILGLFRFVGKGDVLFITGGVGDSARYRTHHAAEELEAHGFKCGITIQDNPFLQTYVKKFKIFIFHRVLFTPNVQKMVENIKKQNKEIIFETDDLVYDPKYLKYMDYFKVMNSLEKKLYENGVGGEILNDPYVKVCTTATSYLAEKLSEHGKKVILVQNKLSQKELEYANIALQLPKREKDGIVRIGYFSGTISHNKDFATITKSLVRILEKYPNSELFLVGPLDIESELNKMKNQIKQLPWVTLEKHFINIASVDINIVPLEIGNPFCESKSELKFIEAGAVKIPTVAAATRPYQEAIIEGVDGFIADGEEQWFQKLEKLILDENLRKSMGEKAREKVLEKYAIQNANNADYYEYLRSKLK